MTRAVANRRKVILIRQLSNTEEGAAPRCQSLVEILVNGAMAPIIYTWSQLRTRFNQSHLVSSAGKDISGNAASWSASDNTNVVLR